MAARILLVEDEQPLVTLLTYNLEAAGHEVHAETRGDTAEDRLRDDVPDLLILDWMLPASRGSSFAGGSARGRRPRGCRSSC